MNTYVIHKNLVAFVEELQVRIVMHCIVERNDLIKSYNQIVIRS